MIKLFSLALVCGCFTTAVLCAKVRYDNNRVYSVNIENEDQLKVLQHLEELPNGIRFLKSPTGVNQSADLVVPPQKFTVISEFFSAHKLKNHIKINNLQKLIDEEQPPISTRASFGWDRYYDLNEIYEWLDDLLEQYPSVLTGYNYGQSYEKRPLRAVKVSSKAGNPTILIESTIHAREWITAATTTYILNELLTSNDTEIQELANKYDWVIVPVANVDGYHYTHTIDRMWRKTRKPFFGGICYGADPNRNYDIHHAESGSSKYPCSETYAGPKPFSEPEVLALSQFTKSTENLKLYLSFHSYSQLLLFPYGYTENLTANHDDLQQIGSITAAAIAQRFGTNYTVGDIAHTIYPASGSSIDWVYEKLNVINTYAFEFRDKGQYGFVLPPDQIIPNSLEIIDGLKAMIKESENLNYF